MFIGLVIFMFVNPTIKHYVKGQLVTFDPCVKSIENFPYITCIHHAKNVFVLYERIDLDSFPSWNDFHGERVLVERGTSCIVLGCEGYPPSCYQIMENPEADLNVYAILVRGYTVKAFGCDLSSK